MNLRMLSGAACLLVALAERSEELAVAYEEGLVLEVTGSSKDVVTLADLTLSIDGNEVESPGRDQAGESTPRVTRVEMAYTDAFLAVSDGAPTKLRRSYETLSKARSEAGEETELTGVLEGETIVLTLVDGEVTAEVEGDTEVDSTYLLDFQLGYPIDTVLPGREVEKGASWEIEGDALMRLLDLAPVPTMFPAEDEDEHERKRQLDELTRDVTDGSATVTFEGVEERDGLSCAVFAVDFEISFEVEGLDPALVGMEDFDPSGAGAEAKARFAFDVEGEDRYWWSVDQKRPVAAEREAEGTVKIVVEQRGEHATVELRLDLELESSETTGWKRLE